MSTTSAYGWNIPDNTDLVKDGALAIRTLGNAIDTSMNTALGTRKAGMVLLNTTSFSGASSHSFGSDAAPIFSSTYTNYRIVVSNLQCSTTDSDFLFRLRANTTDLTSNVYQLSNLIVNNTALTGARVTNGSSVKIGSMGSATANSFVTFEVYRPFQTTPKTGFAQNHYGGAGGLSLYATYEVTSSASYNAFTILSTTNFSGTVSIYGYNV
jgi:hypothetical protein